MFYWGMYAILGALIGSFGTAFIHEKTGRDVQMGGLIGAAVGALLGVPFLVLFWVWLYYDRVTFAPRVYGKTRRTWYRWWD